jgi:hypothetical protein
VPACLALIFTNWRRECDWQKPAYRTGIINEQAFLIHVPINGISLPEW